VRFPDTFQSRPDSLGLLVSGSPGGANPGMANPSRSFRLRGEVPICFSLIAFHGELGSVPKLRGSIMSKSLQSNAYPRSSPARKRTKLAMAVVQFGVLTNAGDSWISAFMIALMWVDRKFRGNYQYRFMSLFAPFFEFCGLSIDNRRFTGSPGPRRGRGGESTSGRGWRSAFGSSSSNRKRLRWCS
jgi:hypothetical protein